MAGSDGAELACLPERASWDERRYGRNLLLFWVKPGREGETPAEPEPPGAD